MAFAPNQIIDCRIESLALGGKGVARTEGMVVFVAGGVPGATVRAKLTKIAKRHAEAEVVETVTPSPFAAEPFCPHFGTCGGCAHQDIAYDKQVEWKAAQVVETLSRLGGARPETVLPPLPSPKTRYYRNKMEFAFVGPARTLHLGLRQRASHLVLDIETCFLQPEKCTNLLLAARQFGRETGVNAFHPGANKGFWRHLVIRNAAATGEIMLHLITTPEVKHFGAAKALGEHLMARPEAPAAFIHSTRSGAKESAFGQRRVLTMGLSHLEERIGEVRYRLSPDAFFQTNTLAAEKLYQTVRELAGLTGRETVYDLYCGVGGIGLYLAKGAGRVIGLELAHEAVADATDNAALNGLTNCEFHAVDLQSPEATVAGLPPPEVIVCDPPREGLDAGVLRLILEARPKRLVYVSCDPATMARDVERLAQAYAPKVLRSMDLFPHTPHMESVLALDLTDKPSSKETLG